MITIYQNPLKLIKNLVLLAVLIPFIALANGDYKMENPAKTEVNLRLALTKHEHSKGLSGIKPSDFPNDSGMLFVNDAMGTRRFWMPDTYFNLDIIFLDSDLKIVGIEKNVPFHPGQTEPPVIYRTKTYQAQFVLETKGNSPFSKQLKVGDQLKWKSKTPLQDVVKKAR